MKRIRNQKPVVYLDDTSTLEKGLPLPYVFYPGHYGAFIGFSKNKTGNISFCSCTYEAIKNYISIRRKYDDFSYSDPKYKFILSSKDFPLKLVGSLLDRKLISDEEILNALHFQDKICHECNNQLPSYRYCHEMYGGVFRQNYGWYVKKQSYEFGIDSLWMNWLENKIPSEIQLAIDPDLKKIKNLGVIEILQPRSDKAKVLQKKIRNQNRKIRNLIENEVREKFGHKKIGEAWTSETILYYLVVNQFPNKQIFRHYRPLYLEGLELDIFIKDLKLAIEYQGLQHFQPVDHWGGKKAYDKLKMRDEKKNILCQKLGIKLVYFDYKEGLSKDYVKTKIDRMV